MPIHLRANANTQLFIKPLKAAAETDKPIISKVDVRLIFSFIEDLVSVNEGPCPYALAADE